MLGTWRWNVGFGILGVGLTVLFSFQHNPWLIVMTRAIYAFLSFFVLAYVARALIAFIMKPPAIISNDPDAEEQPASQLDVSTPADAEDINELLKSQLQDSGHASQQEKEEAFKPLTPKQLVSTNKNQPEELVKAIRHLTGE